MFELLSKILPRTYVYEWNRRLRYANLNISGETLSGFIVFSFIFSFIIGYLLAINDIGGVFAKINVRDVNLVFGGNNYVFERIYIVAFTGTLVYGVIIFSLIYLLVNGFVDLRADRIKRDSERVFPEFLMNLAASLRSGNILDHAMLDAAKEEYGLFSNIVKTRVREYYSGIPIDQAILRLSEDFESIIIRRSFVIIVEGIRTGARLADIIEKLAIDIREIQNYKDEITTSLTTYKSFIFIASVFGMPLLYAISLKLIDILYGVFSQVGEVRISPGMIPINVSFSIPSINKEAFLYFSILSIFITSLFTSLIISGSEGKRSELYKNLMITMFMSYALLYIFINLIQSLFTGLNI
ncbi:MAG: type II secretion system F family protein [Candidatus Micrarchaeota archaeon]|nr:type II secretion system F family protein [Candidatus Micrarchaeota archaeon]MCX8154582.1 type II secretion system F family protein [Candidatus Micrarchaeota archaeon]